MQVALEAHTMSGPSHSPEIGAQGPLHYRGKSWKRLYNQLHRVIDDLYLCCELEGHSAWATAVVHLLKDAAHDFNDLAIQLSTLSKAKAKAPVAWQVRAHRQGSRSPRNNALPGASDDDADEDADQESQPGASSSKVHPPGHHHNHGATSRKHTHLGNAPSSPQLYQQQQHAIDAGGTDAHVGSDSDGASTGDVAYTPTKATQSSRLSRVEYAQHNTEGAAVAVDAAAADNTVDACLVHSSPEPSPPSRAEPQEADADTDAAHPHSPHSNTVLIKPLISRASLEILSSGAHPGVWVDEEETVVVGDSAQRGRPAVPGSAELADDGAGSIVTSPIRLGQTTVVPALLLDGAVGLQAGGSKPGSRRSLTGRDREEGSTPPASPQSCAQGVLLSPGRRRTPQENKQASEEKQARAERTRLAARQQRVEAILTRVAAKDARSRELRERHLAAVVHKAGDETRKVAEVAFINQMLEEDKKLSLQQKLEEGEARRREILEEKLARQKEAAAAAELAVERRRAAECARQAELAEKARRKEAAQAAWAASKEEDRRAQAAAREAAKAAQESLAKRLAMAAQSEATARVLRIEQRLKEAAQRRAERLSTIRDRAALGSLPGVMASLTSPASQTSLSSDPAAQLLDSDLGVSSDTAAHSTGTAAGAAASIPGPATNTIPISPRSGLESLNDASGRKAKAAVSGAAASTGEVAAIPQVAPVLSPPLAATIQAKLQGSGGRGGALGSLGSPSRTQPTARSGSLSGAVQSLSTVSTVLFGTDGAGGGSGGQLTSGSGQATGAASVRNRLKGLRRRAAKMLQRMETDRMSELQLSAEHQALLATGPGSALLKRWTQLVATCSTTSTTNQPPTKAAVTTPTTSTGGVAHVQGADGCAATDAELRNQPDLIRRCSISSSSKHVVISAVSADVDQPQLHEICMAAAVPSGMLTWLAKEVGSSCGQKLTVWDPAPVAAQLLLALVQAPVNAATLLAGGNAVGLVKGAMSALDRANASEAAAVHSMESDAQARELTCLTHVLQTLAVVVQPVQPSLLAAVAQHKTAPVAAAAAATQVGAVASTQQQQVPCAAVHAEVADDSPQGQGVQGCAGGGSSSSSDMEVKQDQLQGDCMGLVKQQGADESTPGLASTDVLHQVQGTSSKVSSTSSDSQVTSKLLLMREHLVGYITASGIIHRLSELFILCDQPMLWRSTEPSTPASTVASDDKQRVQSVAPVDPVDTETDSIGVLSSPAVDGAGTKPRDTSDSGTSGAAVVEAEAEVAAGDPVPDQALPNRQGVETVIQPADSVPEMSPAVNPQQQPIQASKVWPAGGGVLKLEQPPPLSRDPSQSGVAPLPAIPQHVVQGLHLLEVLTERPAPPDPSPPPILPAAHAPPASCASAADSNTAQEPHMQASKRWAPQSENAASMSLAFQETAMAGLPMLLTAVLLHAAPSCTPSEARPEALPENFAEAALSVVRILNNVARLDLPALQSGLASTSQCLGVTHLLAFLISFSTNQWPGQLTTATVEAALKLGCTPCDVSWRCTQDQQAGSSLLRSAAATVALLNEVLLLLGYFVLLNTSNQEVLTWGRPPDSVLSRLMTLPPAYVSHTALSKVLLPSLAALCYNNPRLKELLQPRMPPALLAQALQPWTIPPVQPPPSPPAASTAAGTSPVTCLDSTVTPPLCSQAQHAQQQQQQLPRRYHLSQRLPCGLLSEMEQFFKS